MPKLIYILFFVVLLLPNLGISQNDTTLSIEQVAQYTEQSKQLVSYLEGTLNFLGNPNELPSEKDIIFNESYLKFFVDDKVQVEDDLDENRDISLNKDIQAYLKDIDFFFKQVKFSFEIDEIEQLVTDSNILVFKLSLNRHLEGITVENDTVNNNQLRFIEINLDPLQNDLKIASIYTTKIREQEELRFWWNNMSSEWKNFFGKSIIVYDTLPFKNIEWFSDTSIVTMKRNEVVTSDTAILSDDGITDPPLFDRDTMLIVYDTITQIIPDTISVSTNTIYRLLKSFKNIKAINLSNNLIISELNPLSELSELVELNISNTLIEDLSPIRNLKKLEILDCSGSKVIDIGSIRYISSLKELNLSNNGIDNINAIRSLKRIHKLDLSGSSVVQLDPISELTNLSHLKISNTEITTLNPLSGLRHLSDLNISNSKIKSLISIDSLYSIQNLNIDSTLITNLEPITNLLQLSILQANNTEISNLSPLNNHSSLKVIYCDNSRVGMNEANKFMDINPGCLVIYNSQELVNWWHGLSKEWQTIFKTTYNFAEPITKEKLHVLINQTTLSIANNNEILSLEPLSMLHRLEILEMQNTNVTDLSPLSGLNNLEIINLKNTEVSSLESFNTLHNLKQINIEETEINDISPLVNSKKLDNIYCDNSNVTIDNIVKFKESNNECLILFQSVRNRMWWNSLETSWQNEFQSILDLPPSPSNEELQKLIDLQKLTISNNMLLNNLNPLHVFYKLEELIINNTSISDISPILSLSTLIKLNLSKNPISEVEFISKLFNLEELILENTSIEDLEPISDLNNLIILNIAGTKIKSLKYLEKLAALEKLYINNTRVRNLKPLNQLKKLNYLQCYNTSLKSSKIDTFKTAHPDTEVVYY